jgi:hypothetical protein
MSGKVANWLSGLLAHGWLNVWQVADWLSGLLAHGWLNVWQGC